MTVVLVAPGDGGPAQLDVQLQELVDPGPLARFAESSGRSAEREQGVRARRQLGRALGSAGDVADVVAGVPDAVVRTSLLDDHRADPRPVLADDNLDGGAKTGLPHAGCVTQ